MNQGRRGFDLTSFFVCISDCLIYSYCLVDKELQLWNNIYANINEVEKREKGIKSWEDSLKLLILIELNDNNSNKFN